MALGIALQDAILASQSLTLIMVGFNFAAFAFHSRSSSGGKDWQALAVGFLNLLIGLLFLMQMHYRSPHDGKASKVGLMCVGLQLVGQMFFAPALTRPLAYKKAGGFARGSKTEPL